mmetsp:Transcript_6167/g.12966  ORF Transcript_6167/g.12966 Transcript_6167/m.12966 type:complete len:474 (+) Transcript_6167:337-1758(+)
MVLVTVCAPVSCDSTDPSSSSSDGHAEDVPLARSKCCSSKLKLVSSLSLLFSMRGPLIVERKRSWSRMTARSSERDRRMESVWDSRVWILWCMASSSSSSTECVSSSSSWSWSPPSSSSSSSSAAASVPLTEDQSPSSAAVPFSQTGAVAVVDPIEMGATVIDDDDDDDDDEFDDVPSSVQVEFEFEFEFEFVRFAIPAVARPAGRRRPHDRPEDVRHAKDVAAPTFRRHDDRVFALFVLRSVFRFFLFFFRRARVRNQNAGVVAPGEGRDVRPPIEREAKAGAFGVGGAAAEGLDEAGVVGEEVFVGVGGGVVVGREGDPSKFQISLQRRRNFFLCRGRGRRRRLGRLRPFLFFLCFFLRCLRRHLREIGIIGGKAADHVALDASSQIPLPLLLLVVVVVVAIEIGKVPPHAASSCAADVLVASLADPLATTGILTLALALVLAGGLADAAAAASSSSSSGHVGGFAYSMVW